MEKQEKVTLQFIRLLERLPEREYIKSVIAYSAAPTIRSEKPSSLITFTNDRRRACDLWRLYGKEICRELNLLYEELFDQGFRIHVLFYRKECLEACLMNSEAKAFLRDEGYKDTGNVKLCLNRLKRRYVNCCPHEIGIFLGIPADDVASFIAHKGKNCILCRYWKVYHNSGKAESLFRSYDRAHVEARNAIEALYRCSEASEACAVV